MQALFPACVMGMKLSCCFRTYRLCASLCSALWFVFSTWPVDKQQTAQLYQNACSSGLSRCLKDLRSVTWGENQQAWDQQAISYHSRHLDRTEGQHLWTGRARQPQQAPSGWCMSLQPLQIATAITFRPSQCSPAQQSWTQAQQNSIKTCPDLCGPKNAQPAVGLDTTSWTVLSNAAGRPEATAEPVIEAMERVVCWSANGNMMFLPCGHTCTCTACAQPFVQDAIYSMCQGAVESAIASDVLCSWFLQAEPHNVKCDLHKISAATLQ